MGDVELANEEPRARHRTKQWIGPVLTTLIGIIATIAVGWYQIDRAEEEAATAERERARSIRQNLVSVVEERILNGQPVDVGGLARLIDLRRREERVTTPISSLEVIELAEFNILSSRYLAFERKESLRLLFEGTYRDIALRYSPRFRNIPNADLANQLAKSIQDGKRTEALEQLQRVIDAYAKDVTAAQARSRREVGLTELIDEIRKNPFIFVTLVLGYAVALAFMRPFLRRFFKLRLDSRVDEENVRKYGTDKPQMPNPAPPTDG